MKLIFDETKLTLGDLAELEEGRTTKQTIKFLVKFVVDENGQPASIQDAYTWVYNFSIPEGRTAMQTFWAWSRSLKADAVNPPPAANSGQP